MLRGRVDPQFGEPPPGYVAGRGRGATALAGGVSRDNAATEPPADLSDGTFDKFSGYQTDRLLSAAPDAEDLAAEAAYASVEAKMDERRRTQREAKFKEELQKQRAEHATLAQQLAPLKRGLANITTDEWEAIPDIGDKTLKKKRPKMFSLAPESLLIAAQAADRTEKSIDTTLGGATPIGLMGGIATPLISPTSMRVYGSLSGYSSMTPSLSDLGEARGTVLTAKLDRIGDSVSGQTVIDPKNFLTDLNSRPVTTDQQIADLRKSRALLRSVTKTNPTQHTGWIAAARLEEVAGQMDAARDVIIRGCLQCPSSEEIWLEAARLERPDKKAEVLNTALKRVPASVKLWLEMANSEPDIAKRKIIFRQALSHVPNSVRLWKEAVALESDPADARLLLYGAIRQVPANVELRLSLAKLCDRREAQSVLNDARKAIPTSFQIWCAAAELEERKGDPAMVGRIIRSGLAALTKRGVAIDREDILTKAEEAEAEGLRHTCEALAAAALPLGPATSINAWLADAKGAVLRNRPFTARYLFREALTILPADAALWLAYLRFEATAETLPDRTEIVDEAIERATSILATNEQLWLAAVEAKQATSGLQAARHLLNSALTNVYTKNLALAAIHIDCDLGNFTEARNMLTWARQQLPACEVLWIEAIYHERHLSGWPATRALLERALAKFPDSTTLVCLAAKLYANYAAPEGHELALQLLENATQKHSSAACLWLTAAELHMEGGQWVQARVLLEKARIIVPKDEDICAAAVELELGAGGVPKSALLSADLTLPVASGTAGAAAVAALSRGLRDTPRNSRLWSLAIRMEPRSKQNAKAVDALTSCENDAGVVLTIARLFQQNKKPAKARAWFKRATKLNHQLADAWIFWLLFEAEAEGPLERVAAAAMLAKPNGGYYWKSLGDTAELYLQPFHVKLLRITDALKPGFSSSLQPEVRDVFQSHADAQAIAALRDKAADIFVPRASC